MADCPISLAERRWNKTRDPAESSIVDMLRVAIEQIERGEIKPQHAILCMGSVSDGNGASTDWFQAGAFDGFRQYGLLERTKHGIMASAEVE